MKMIGRKAIVFWVINCELVALFFATLFVASDMIASVGVTIIIMIVGNGATYIGGNVATKWTHSKHYRPELDKPAG